ncbi:hypothetical protein RQP46_002173 [Phenoliferia psychrophenolica]
MARVLFSTIAADPALAPAVSALDSVGIKTAVDLLFTPTIPPHPDLPHATLTSLKSLASVHLAAPRVSGATLLQQHRIAFPAYENQEDRLTTTVTELDDLLGGGYKLGRVVEIAGAKSSFKSLLALQGALTELLVHPLANVAWIDTEGAFDSHRCLAVAKGLLADLRAANISFTVAKGNMDDQEKAMKAMDRLSVSKCLESGAALDGIVAELERDVDGRRTRMVVIDSIVPLLGGDALTNASSIGHAHLVAFMRRLTSLAQSPTQPLVILIVNSATTIPPASHAAPFSRFPTSPGFKPALGSTFSYLTDVTLWLTRGDAVWDETDSAKGVVEVARNRFGESQRWTAFTTADGTKLRGLR